MTATKRVQRLAVAAVVLSGGALVASPTASTAAPAERVSSVSASTSEDSTGASATSTARRAGIECELTLQFRPRVGPGHKHIRSRSKVRCGTKRNPGPRMPHIWTSIQLKQTKAPDKYKKTDQKNTRRNKATVRTYCPRERRGYKVIARATVKLPKSAVKKQLKLERETKWRYGTCR